MTRAISICLAIFTTAAMAAQPATLDHHRWNHRLLVIPKPTTAIESALVKNRAALEERDVVVIRLMPDEPTAITKQIASRYQLTATSKEILLIGKDGRTTVRWPLDEFTFEKIFQRIDSMPMRRREMRER